MKPSPVSYHKTHRPLASVNLSCVVLSRQHRVITMLGIAVLRVIEKSSSYLSEIVVHDDLATPATPCFGVQLASVDEDEF